MTNEKFTEFHKRLETLCEKYDMIPVRCNPFDIGAEFGPDRNNLGIAKFSGSFITLKLMIK